MERNRPPRAQYFSPRADFSALALAFPANRFYNPHMLAFQLHQLQEIDTGRDRLQAEIRALEARLADRSAIEAAGQAVAAAKVTLERARQALRAAEAEAESVRQKIRRTEQTLYGGQVRNPKELQDLQREAEALKRLLAVKEDAQLEAMLAAEEAENAFRAAETRLNALQEERLQQEARWNGDLATHRQRLATLDQRRQHLTTTLPGDALNTYERLRQSRGGLAVATVTEGACDACGAPLTPDLLRAARSPDTLAFCRTCKRILYIP